MKAIGRAPGRRAILRLIACAALCVSAPALATVYPGDAVKAAFLHRFGVYVQWPSTDVGSEPFTIAVMGADGVAVQLERLLPGLIIKNRRARVRRVDVSSPLDGVHVLYVGSGNLRRARPLLAAAAERPILIVTDDAEGLARGGLINFIQVERNIRFEVSLDNAERSHLKLDAALLSIAVRVEHHPPAPREE